MIGARGRSETWDSGSTDSYDKSVREKESFGSSVRNHVEPNNLARNSSELDDMLAQHCLMAGMTAR